MELKKEYIQVQKIKSRATIQVTFDADYNVPDAKADIGRMIQTKGNVMMGDVRLTEGHAVLKGNLNVDILYVTEGEGTVSSLLAKLPFEEIMNLEGINSGDKMCLQWDIEDLTVHVIHSRKMNIKGIVIFEASVEELAGISLPIEAEGKNISVKKKNFRLMSLQVNKKDTLRIKKEILLASNRPNIAELLWHTVQVRGLDVRPEENEILVKGELFVFVLYKGEGEGPLQWAEYSIPFAEKAACNGAGSEMIPNIGVSIFDQNIEVKPDADGEERVLLADVVLELNIHLYQEENYNIIQDIYVPMKDCELFGKIESLESLLVRNFSKCRISDRVAVKETQGKILQICHSDGRVKVDKTEIVENGILAEGIISLKILYIVGNDEIPFYSMEVMLPFSHIIEANIIQKDSNYYLQASLEQLSVTMADSNEIEIRATAGLNTLVLTRQEMMLTERVEERELDQKTLRNLPGIRVYTVKKQDTLWDIAKQCYTTVEEIKRMNNIEEQDIKPGKKLLIMKKILE